MNENDFIVGPINWMQLYWPLIGDGVIPVEMST